MTRDDEPISVQDLEAYADGLLDRHPARRLRVEKRLRANPVESKRVWDHQAQNALIVERYGDILEEPVPERLRRTLDASTPVIRFARVAVVGGAMLASGLLGWGIGHDGEISPSTGRLMALLDQAGQIGTITPAGSEADFGDVQPLGWLSEELTIPLHLPDLSPFGYRHVGKRLIGSGTGQAVELLYAGADGKRVVLLLAPRWEEASSSLQVGERDGLRVAYGFQGPVGYGVAGDLNEDTIRKLARAVQDSWRASSETNNAASGVGREEMSGLAPVSAPAPSISSDGAM